MDVQIIENIIAENPEAANEPLVIYYAQTISTSITMPLATRNAFIRSWNVEFKRLYGAKPETLWLKDLSLSLVAVNQKAVSMADKTPPVDILFDHLESVKIELTDGWQQRFEESLAEFEVKCAQATRQINTLMNATISAMVKVPAKPNMFNFKSLPDFAKAVSMYNASLPAIKNARRCLVPKVYGLVTAVDVGRFTSGYDMVQRLSLSA